MICQNPGCHCQTESGVMRDGRIVCSLFCTRFVTGIDEPCPCGHAGCASSEGAPIDFFDDIAGALLLHA